MMINQIYSHIQAWLMTRKPMEFYPTVFAFLLLLQLKSLLLTSYNVLLYLEFKSFCFFDIFQCFRDKFGVTQ